VAAYRLVDVRAPNGDGPATRPDLVGRRAELSVLIELLEESVTRPTPRLMLVLGEAGVGKTRLVDEFASTASGGALVLRGRCLSYGEGITFWPIVEALRNAAAIDDEDDAAAAVGKLRSFIGDSGEEIVDRVASTLGLGTTPYSVAEIFLGLRRLLEWFARERSVVLVIEDLHWAEPTLHDLLDALQRAETVSGALILATARTEVLEKRPQLGAGPMLRLERLGVQETSAMIEELLGAPLDRAGLERIVEASSGNPLFAQQLVSMLRDEGQLVPERDGWVLSALPEGRLPPTIHALLSSRIDGLERSARNVLDPAAVIGHIFPLPAIVEMADGVTVTDVTTQADELTRTQFLALAPERESTEFRAFHHAFIRDSVYESLLKRQRATLHEQFVKWADVVNGDRALEYEEILGYHVEQAYRFLSELAPADEHVRELGADAGRRLASAGRRAFVRGDMPAAANLLGRAIGVLPPESSDRIALAPDLGEALMQLGDFEAAEAVVTSAEREATLSGRPELAGGSWIVKQYIHVHSGAAENWSDEAQGVGEAVVAASSGHDPASVARAYRLLGLVASKACRYGDAAAAFGKAVDAAREAGDIRQERRASGAFAQTSTLGPIDVEEALARCARATEGAAGDRHAEASLLNYAGHLEAMRGDFDLGRSMCRAARERCEELGLRLESAAMALESAHVEELAADLVAVEHELRRGFDILSELGERFVRSSVAGLLADALVEQGRFGEAEGMTVVAESLSDEDDIDAQVIWRCARAKVLAAGDRIDEAEALAREAIALIEPTDFVVIQITVYRDMAVIFWERHPDEAKGLFDRARELAEAKGSTAHVARVLAVVERTVGA
jgi:tetratricopeptide (TPR) repeat protein